MANRFRPNDRVLVPTNGKLGKSCGDGRKVLNVKHSNMNGGEHDFGEIEEQLAEKLEALQSVNETSSV